MYMAQTIVSSKDKPAVILLHGLLGSLSNWLHVEQHLADRYTVYIPSLPVADKLMGNNALDSLSDFLDNYIKANQIVKPILVGNSLGGHLALLYTLQYPDKVKKLVLTGSSGLYESSLGATFIKVRDYDYLKRKVEEVFKNKEVVSKELIDDVYHTTRNPLKVLAIINLARAARKQNLKNSLSKIKHPVLLIWGKQDNVTPINVAYEFQTSIPHSDLRVIDNCGHVPMMEHPELFNRYLTEFLSA
jgi:pimeloyl-ACP methyl ester carboxylesterase